VKSITTFQSPPADNLYRLVEVHCVHNFEQPLLLWAVIAGLRAGPGKSLVCTYCQFTFQFPTSFHMAPSPLYSTYYHDSIFTTKQL